MPPKQNPGASRVGSISEKQFPILPACHLSVRYEDNQLDAAPYVPYQADKLVMRMLWSMLSNTAKRSSSVSAGTVIINVKANVFMYF